MSEKDAEQWRIVVGFTSHEVSNMGNVRRRLSSRGTPKGYKFKPGSRSGYPTVMLRHNGERTHRYIHRLVAEAFIGECPADYEVNHINGVRSDNRLSNLEYVTRSENALHSYRIGNSYVSRAPRRKASPGCIGGAPGELNVNSKLTESQVRKMLELKMNGVSVKTIAMEFGVVKSTVYEICSRRKWRHLNTETR